MIKKFFNNIINKVKNINITKENIKNIPSFIAKKFKKYLSTNILFLTYVVTSVLISFILRYNTVGNVKEIKASLCDVTIVAIIGAFGYLIKPKNQFKYFFGFNLLYTILCIVNSVYYTFYSGFISVSLLSTVTMLGEVSDSVTSKLKLIYFVYLISPLIMLIVHRLLKKKNYYFNVGKEEKGKQMFIKTGAFGLAIIFIVLTNLTSAEASRLIKLWNRDYVVQRFGIYMYTVNDLVQSVYPSINTMFGYEEARTKFIDFYNKKEEKQSNAYTNIFEGKNVLFIHAESIQNFLIDLEVNGMEITPNLNRIAKEGLYFSSFYPQISVGTSSDTEFTLSTGLLPSTSGTVFVNYYNRTYETMQNAFKKKGYFTFSSHANAATYWNRQEMYKSLGYDAFYAKDSFVVPEDDNDPDIVGLGLSDESFYEQLRPILNDVREKNSPFMGLIISLSNHSPFNDVEKYGSDLDFSITFNKNTGETDENGNEVYEEVTVPYLENTEMGNYLKSAHYADKAYGELFEIFKEDGFLENTVIILYGDHEAKLGKKNFNLLYNYDPLTEGIKSKEDPTYISLDNYRYDLLKNTPLIIWTGDKSLKKEIKDVMGMWDVYPTVANMFNLDYTYALGHDIFSNNEKIVVFPSGDFLTNKVYYNNLKDEYILLTDEPIDNDFMIEYINRLKAYAETRQDISKSIIVHDLIKREIEREEGNKK